tara:strand:+ start:282 stop:497 length:216 start_codon:yes stop_codon:yes gene_type:complete
MSSEKISIASEKDISILVTPEVAKKELPGRVDINDLLARVREEKKKENKVNLVFLGLFASVILVVGIILSF